MAASGGSPATVRRILPAIMVEIMLTVMWLGGDAPTLDILGMVRALALPPVNPAQGRLGRVGCRMGPCPRETRRQDGGLDPVERGFRAPESPGATDLRVTSVACGGCNLEPPRRRNAGSWRPPRQRCPGLRLARSALHRLRDRDLAAAARPGKA